MKPEISIIVPVYKVEKYINRCIDSILNQTFKDFELILVDDGSPDNCGKICDEYAHKDSRVKVIHKENGGLSSARNAGLDIAQGEYIGFVDSDDYIENNMYETLYNLCIDNQADIGVISSRIIKDGKSTVRESSGLKIFDRDEAMKELAISKYYDEVVWTKLFKKEILGELRFKFGVKHEDTDFTYRVVDKCKRLAYIGKPMYNYIIRDGSTMSRASKEFCIDHIQIYEEMYEFYKQKYPECKMYILDRLANSGLSILNRMVNSDNKANREKIIKVRQVLNKYFLDILTLKILNRNLKIVLIALRANINLYKFIMRRIREKKRI